MHHTLPLTQLSFEIFKTQNTSLQSLRVRHECGYKYGKLIQSFVISATLLTFSAQRQFLYDYRYSLPPSFLTFATRSKSFENITATLIVVCHAFHAYFYYYYNSSLHKLIRTYDSLSALHSPRKWLVASWDYAAAYIAYLPLRVHNGTPFTYWKYMQLVGIHIYRYELCFYNADLLSYPSVLFWTHLSLCIVSNKIFMLPSSQSSGAVD